MRTVDVQVITYAPTAFYHCQHCEIAFGQIGLGPTVHREQARTALPDDLLQDFALLSDRLAELRQRFGERVRLTVVDAASLEGFLKSLRFRVRAYPAVIIEGVKRDAGGGYEHLGSLVYEALAAREEVGVRATAS